MRRSNFALRLQPSLLEEARKAAEGEGVALNQLINVAIAEKVSALRTEDYFQARAARANREAALRALARAGKGNQPMAGDELPSSLIRGKKSGRVAKSQRIKGRKERSRRPSKPRWVTKFSG